jgi:hypothetical protein
MHKAAHGTDGAKGPQLWRRVTLITFESELFREPLVVCTGGIVI